MNQARSPRVKRIPTGHQLKRKKRSRRNNPIQCPTPALHRADLLFIQGLHARAYGDTPGTNSALVPWEDLPPSLKSANLAQAEDIPYNLRALGYEIVDSGGVLPSEIVLDPELVEPLARAEHDRWMTEKQRVGWVYAAERDNAKFHHPLLVPYEEISEAEKDKDRVTLKNIPALLARADYRVTRI